MEDMQERILEQSMDMFFRYGIRSVTMDDVAKEMGISKKTLYKFFSNKADLVAQGVKWKFNQVSSVMKSFGQNSANAIDELFAIDAYFDEMMRQNHPAIMFQLSKYYPKAYKWLDQNKAKLVIEMTRLNIKKGIDQGLYKPDLNIEYISYIYMAHTNIMEEGSGVPEEICHSAEFHRHHLHYHIRGIASQKGLEYLNQKLSTK